MHYSRRADVEYSVQLSSFKNKRGNHRRAAAAAAAASGGEEAQTASTTLVVDMAEWNGSVVTIETRPSAASKRRFNDLSKPPEEESRERDAANGATSLRLGENSK